MIRIAFCILAFAVAFNQTCEAMSQEHITAGKDALSQPGFPWYDSNADSLKEVPMGSRSKTSGSSNRNSSWRSSRKGGNTGGGGGGAGMTTMNGTGFSGMGALFWVVVAMLLLATTAVLVWAFFRKESDDDEEKLSSLLEDRDDETRLQNLPFEVAASQLSLFERAKQLYGEGRYKEAIVYLYSHMLMELDRNQRIRLAKAKTNRQYLREIKDRPSLAGIFHKTMLVFEDAFFGHIEIGKEQFDDCWQSVPEFERMVSE